MDIKIIPGPEGGDFELINGDPISTDELFNAVYLSIFTPDWWGNALADSPEKMYSSKINELTNNQTLSMALRNDIIESVKESLEWLRKDRVVSRFDVEGIIPRPGILFLTVRLYEPVGRDYKFQLSWNAQEAA